MEPKLIVADMVLVHVVCVNVIHFMRESIVINVRYVNIAWFFCIINNMYLNIPF